MKTTYVKSHQNTILIYYELISGTQNLFQVIPESFNVNIVTSDQNLLFLRPTLDVKLPELSSRIIL